jgi:hypothetical protein
VDQPSATLLLILRQQSEGLPAIARTAAADTTVRRPASTSANTSIRFRSRSLHRQQSHPSGVISNGRDYDISTERYIQAKLPRTRHFWLARDSGRISCKIPESVEATLMRRQFALEILRQLKREACHAFHVDIQIASPTSFVRSRPPTSSAACSPQASQRSDEIVPI